MKDNGTDRDVALQILDGLTSCANLVASVNDNLYVPHITTQPTSQTVALNATATFSVTAINVSAYEWQYKGTGAWREMFVDATGATTDTLSFAVTEYRYTYTYRCKITGKNGNVIYSDEVTVIAPEAEG